MSRAITFERECLALAAGSVADHPLGRWMRSAAHPDMWAMNQLYVEGRHVCTAATGPVGLYAELGLRAAGRFWTFNRPA